MTRNLLEQEPGRENRHENAAGIPKIAQQKRKRHNGDTPYCIGAGVTRLQVAFLMRVHGLTEAQANALAVLVWEGAQ